MSEGELCIDHRDSPGLPEAMAVALGLPARMVGAGGFFEAAMIRCNHCGVSQIRNPGRVRPRYNCQSCGYVCDVCAEAMTQQGYVHRTIEQITDMVCSGQYAISGPSSAPILTRINHGS